MASTYTTRNRFRKPARGDYVDSWGDVLNDLHGLIDDSLDGLLSLALTGDVSLSVLDGTADQSRLRIIRIASSSNPQTITIPAVQKWYLVINASYSDITVTTGSGTSWVVEGKGGVGGSGIGADAAALLICDGTNVLPFRPDGWTLQAVTAVSAGVTTEVGFALDRTKFSEFRIPFTGVNQTSGGSVNFRLGTSNTSDAFTYLTFVSAATATSYDGQVDIQAARISSTLWMQRINGSVCPALASSGTHIATATTLAALDKVDSANVIKFDLNATVFQAGTFLLWAR